jgi:TPR repeat protein
VFAVKCVMVTDMETPWYRKLLAFRRTPDAPSTQIKADGGDADAQFSLGLRLGAGQGDSQDFVQAAEWYRKAADQNHALAQFNLGLMYAKGQGVPRDDAAAVQWIRKAAEAGDAGAQFDMGTRYHRASLDGLKMDAAESKIEAFKWLHLAAAQGYRGSAAACEMVTLTMSLEEVTEGNQRATAFVAGKPLEP